MTNARPGYWDVDCCAWVVPARTDVVPPARSGGRHDEPVTGADEAAVPTPRADVDATAPLGPETPAG